MHSLFPHQLLVKAEKEISHREERHSTGSSQKKPDRYPYASSAKPSQESERMSGVPAWKQIMHRQQSKKGYVKELCLSTETCQGAEVL